MPARLSADRWRVLIPHLDRALEVPEAERSAWLSSVAAEDARLAADIAALLEKHDLLEEQGFLASPVAMVPPRRTLAGQACGAYTLRSPLGQGGMGSVWLADRSDGRFQGVVAVKMLNASLLGHDAEARFRREGSILARLRHPHIAHLIDAGVSDHGQPYLALEHVDGERIDRYCDAHRLGIEARVRLFLDVLAAVSHAHANLVVHRDLKPSNVLVGSDGRVKLLDFGIAKLLESDAAEPVTALTRDGESMLTPEYAAPEQLTGGAVTTATDVYALGALLYLLLAGRHPASEEAQSPADLVRAIVDTDARRLSDAAALDDRADERAVARATTPRRLRATLRGDLDNIVTRALKKDAAERYPSAEAMADDLRRYLDHLPVRARADSLGYRTRKFVARHRVGLAAAAAVALALAASAGVAVRQARVSARERDRALLELRRAEATIDLTGFLLAEATPTEGRPVTNEELLARGDAIIDRRYANDPAMRVHMLLMLADRYQENQQYDRWEDTVERAFQSSRGLAEVGLRSRAACAKAHVLVDKAPRERNAVAEALLSEAFRDLAAVPDAASDEAYCRVQEADMANTTGDPARAVTAAERAVALEEGRGAAAGRRFDAGVTLANAYMVAGRPESADRANRQLIAMLESQGLGESRDAAIVFQNWSAMWQGEGQHLRAVPLSERAVHIARTRDLDRGAAASFVRAYGMALCAVGRCAEAVPFVEEGVAKARTQHSTRRLVAQLVTVSHVSRETGDLDRAAGALKEAEAVLSAGPDASPYLYSLLDRGLARLSLARGDFAGAVKLALRALGRLADADREPPDTMNLQLTLAEACNERGDFDAARAAAEHALPVALEILGDLPHSLHVGQARLELGVALAGQGHVEEGRAELRKALEHLLASVGPAAASTKRAQDHLARL